MLVPAIQSMLEQMAVVLLLLRRCFCLEASVQQDNTESSGSWAAHLGEAAEGFWSVVWPLQCCAALALIQHHLHRPHPCPWALPCVPVCKVPKQHFRVNQIETVMLHHDSCQCKCRMMLTGVTSLANVCAFHISTLSSATAQCHASGDNALEL